MSVSLPPLPACRVHSADIVGFDVERFAATAMRDSQNLAAVIDYTILSPTATSNDIIRACEESLRYRFACVAVNPCWVSVAHSVLSGTDVKVGSVAGFPLGASLTRTKCEEAEAVLRLGAREIDMVLNIGALKGRDNDMIRGDLDAMVAVTHGAGAKLKVILEMNSLALEEKLRASEICVAAGVDFLNTASGLSGDKATDDNVRLLRGVAGGLCGVKAAGSLRTLDDVRVMLTAGANRIGTSAAVAIMESFSERMAMLSNR